MSSIQETIRAVLGADETLTALVGDRIYPGQIPDDEEPTPWLYFAVPTSTPFDELDEDDPVSQHTVEFHVFADRYAVAKAVIDGTIAALNTYGGGQITRAFWQETTEQDDDDGYHHACRIDVWARHATVIALTPSGGRITTGAGFVKIEAGGHILTLTSAGLLLDGQPVGAGGGSGGNLDGGTPSTNYGGLDPIDGGSP